MGRWPLSLQRIRSPIVLGRSATSAITGSARPARRRDQPRGFRTGDSRIDIPALGDRRRSVHPRGEGDRQRRGTGQPRCSESAVSRFGLRLFRFNCPQRLDTEVRPRDEVAARCARIRVGGTRIQERRVQPVVNGGGPRVRAGVGVELRRRMEKPAHGRPFQTRRFCLRHGLHEPAGADAHRDRGLRHSERGSGDDSRRRSGEHVTDRARY